MSERLRTSTYGGYRFYTSPNGAIPPAPRGGPSRHWRGYGRGLTPPKGNPPTRTINLSQRMSRVIDMRDYGRGYEFTRQLAARAGRSLPGYTPRINRPLLLGERLLQIAPRIDPRVRLLQMSFEAYHVVTNDSPWAVTGEGAESGYEFEENGFTRCSNTAEFPEWPGCPGNGWQVRLGSVELCNLVGSALQPNTGRDGDAMPLPASQPWQVVSVSRGPLSGPPAICGTRYGIAEVWTRAAGVFVPATTLEWTTGGSPIVSRLPGLRPRPSTVTETWTSPSRARRLRGRRPRRYEREALEWSSDRDRTVPVSSGDGGGRWRWTPHVLRPPYPHEREVKTRMSAARALKLIATLYDAATEAVDVVDILWDHMTRKPPFRPGRPYTFTEKANYIWRNLDALDVDAAMIGLIRNHFEDKYIYGRIFGITGRHSPFGTQLPVSNALRQIGDLDYGDGRPWWAG